MHRNFTANIIKASGVTTSFYANQYANAAKAISYRRVHVCRNNTLVYAYF